MSARWWEGPFVSFDVESTGVDPETARIVTAACIAVGAEGVLDRKTWLVDPGVEIPEGATKIHGVTTEQARAEGMDASVAVAQIAHHIGTAWERGIAVVIMNASYDTTVLAREMARYDHGALDVGPVIDPMVIDRAVDKYRKGGRKLVDLAEHYGVRLDGAHAADEDALTAARVVWKQARHPKHSRVLQAMTLAEMQVWQANAQKAWASNYQDYLRTKANPRVPDAVIDPSWPVRAVATQEGAVA